MVKYCALPSYSRHTVANLHPDSRNLAAPIPCLFRTKAEEVKDTRETHHCGWGLCWQDARSTYNVGAIAADDRAPPPQVSCTDADGGGERMKNHKFPPPVKKRPRANELCERRGRN